MAVSPDCVPRSRPLRRFIRHWKERYTKGMPLIFIRDVRLDGKRLMKAGDPVTPELRAELGEHRMKMWWAAKRVGCATMAVVPASPGPVDPPCGLNLGDDKAPETTKDKFDSKANFGGKPKGKKG